MPALIAGRFARARSAGPSEGRPTSRDEEAVMFDGFTLERIDLREAALRVCHVRCSRGSKSALASRSRVPLVTILGYGGGAHDRPCVLRVADTQLSPSCRSVSLSSAAPAWPQPRWVSTAMIRSASPARLTFRLLRQCDAGRRHRPGEKLPRQSCDELRPQRARKAPDQASRGWPASAGSTGDMSLPRHAGNAVGHAGSHPAPPGTNPAGPSHHGRYRHAKGSQAH